MDNAKERINDFAFKIANTNGTGSASANGLIMQAIFRMGVPVSGKNLFPSNIQGLPTWYEIRVNAEGHTARTPVFDLVVAMNAETYARDLKELRAGAYLLYDSTWPLDEKLRRDDVHLLGIPLAKMCRENFEKPREQVLMKNIMYAGALAALLDIDMKVIDTLLEEKYGKKQSMMALNHKAIQLGYRFAKQHFQCPLPFRLKTMDATKNSIMIDGNTALALGCVFAGATVAAWYPITPSTSLMDAFRGFCAVHRKDPETGKNNFAILQAEDELSAIGMVLGASWSGARSFTSTSGPGISLMNELIGLAYYAEIPAVIVDVQRTGPSTGMPTRTQQGDILECAYASHGDTKHILLFPANPEECFYFAPKAFDLAERFQTPVFVLTDLDIGMNDWMIPRLEWDDGYKPDRGRVLSAAELEALPKWARYSDADADGVTTRTLPGVHPKGAYFTRGSGHNSQGKYTEIPDEYQEVVDRLTRKHKSAAKYVPAPDIRTQPGATIGVVTVGGCDQAVREGIEGLKREGIKANFMRVKGFPFGGTVEEFLHSHDTIFVVEQNRDAQLRTLLINETSIDKERMKSVLAYGGFPLSAYQVIDGIKAQLKQPTGEAL
ncbi:MAG TPA: 2-oxoacid:acceptor oxidoreductase subunit alpha [Polyangia bacterium]|nr:2-oxoacid:acceptor oxidoreductase subunit alpha [Polyangia bacterium]